MNNGFNIHDYPDGCLRKKAEPVDVFDDELSELVSKMLETMREAKGRGLAAPQVNINKRIFVMHNPELPLPQKVFINPEITPLTADMVEYNEGCLSFPDLFAIVERPSHIRISAVNEKGEPFIYELSGIAARCALHETDHLDGKLFIDYLSETERKRVIEEMKRKSLVF